MSLWLLSSAWQCQVGCSCRPGLPWSCLLALDPLAFLGVLWPLSFYSWRMGECNGVDWKFVVHPWAGCSLSLVIGAKGEHKERESSLLARFSCPRHQGQSQPRSYKADWNPSDSVTGNANGPASPVKPTTGVLQPPHTTGGWPSAPFTNIWLLE